MLLTAFCKKLCPGMETVSKSVRMMKILTLFLFAGCLQLSAKMAAQGLSLSLNNVPISTAFNEIRKQTAYRFVYTNEQLSAASKITLRVQNASLEKVLELCFKDQPLTWSIEDKYIIVKPKEKKIIAAPAAENEIRGKVSNDKGEPVVGATVGLKVTQKATATDNNGEFVLADIPSGSVVIISSIGYQSQEVIIGNNRYLFIHLQTSVSALDEMVIKGYYNTSKRLNTGSVSKLSSEQIAMQPLNNPIAALSGRLPGVYVQQTSGVSGAGFKVQIRGQNSISNGNNALYVVDGMPFSSNSISSLTISGNVTGGGNPFNNINPSDIESIEVLKDADATAIYGSRGANGVILITTKKGRPGPTVVDVNFYEGVGKVGSYMKLLNSQQYLQMRHEAFKNDGVANLPPSAYDLNGTWDTTHSTDWLRELLGGTAHISNAQLAISGGDTNTQFRIGGNFRKETSVFPGNFPMDKISGNMSIHHVSPDKKFSAVISTSYTVVNNNLPAADLTSAAIILPPVSPGLYDNNGNLNWANGTFNNPLAYTEKKYKSTTNTLLTNMVLDYNLTKGLGLKANLGYTKMSMNEMQINPLKSFNPAYGYTPGDTYSYYGTSAVGSWIVEPQVSWKKDINKSKIEILTGLTFQQSINQSQTQQGTGFSNQVLMENIAAAASVNTLNYGYQQYRYFAYFGRVNYNLQEKYLLNVTARRDGSSRFGPDKQFANFGAIGAAWIFTNERFAKSFSILSFGKLRASYGTSGNDQIGDYQYLNTWTPTTYPYMGTSGLYPTRLLNPDYRWEENKKFEMAVELGFLADKILFNAGYYKNRSNNQLVGYPLAPSTGFNSIQFNLPALVQNTGFELSLSTTNIRKQHFLWNTSVNLSLPRNKLLSFPGIGSSAYNNFYAIGQPLTVLKAYHFTGVNPQTGIYTFEDADKDGNISYPNDLQALKNIGLNYYGGFNNHVQYKNWQLDIFIQFVKQTGKNYSSFFPLPGNKTNQPTDIMGRWKQAGDNTAIQQFTQTSNSAAAAAYNKNQFYSDNVISDASFIRLKNVAVSYQISDKSKNKLKARNLRIYLEGHNLFTITRYIGLDPETQANTLPPLRLIVAGIQLTL